MKKDLRDDADVIKELAKAKETPISYERGKELSRTINAECYLECSTAQGEGVDEVFRKAAEVLNSKNKAFIILELAIFVIDSIYNFIR